MAGLNDNCLTRMLRMGAAAPGLVFLLFRKRAPRGGSSIPSGSEQKIPARQAEPYRLTERSGPFRHNPEHPRSKQL